MNAKQKKDVHIHISGPAGIGKSRLARAIAGVVDAQVDGVAFSAIGPSSLALAELRAALYFVLVQRTRIIITTDNKETK